MTLTTEARLEWADHQAANRRARIEYAEHPLALVRDDDTRCCHGCTHRTAHPTRFCAACRKERSS